LGGHLVAAAIGGVVLFALALVMYFSLRQGLPFAGIPVPIALRDPLVDAPRIALLALWIDIMAGTLLFSLPSILRNRAPRGQITSRRPETGR
jgi:hypothetical protein